MANWPVISNVGFHAEACRLYELKCVAHNWQLNRPEAMFKLTPQLTLFLREAKLATYAAQGGDGGIPLLLPDSKQLEYSRGRYLYRDIYVGVRTFVGQEVVYFDNRATWSMAYSGGILSAASGSEVSAIYRALRVALSAVPDELPLRGPSVFEHEGHRYSCCLNGGIERFHGGEAISSQGRLVYELQFTGGRLA